GQSLSDRRRASSDRRMRGHEEQQPGDRWGATVAFVAHPPPPGSPAPAPFRQKPRLATRPPGSVSLLSSAIDSASNQHGPSAPPTAVGDPALLYSAGPRETSVSLGETDRCYFTLQIHHPSARIMNEDLDNQPLLP